MKFGGRAIKTSAVRSAIHVAQEERTDGEGMEHKNRKKKSAVITRCKYNGAILFVLKKETVALNFWYSNFSFIFLSFYPYNNLISDPHSR